MVWHADNTEHRIEKLDNRAGNPFLAVVQVGYRTHQLFCSARTRAPNAPRVMAAFTPSAVNGVGAAAIVPPVELTRGACEKKDKGRTCTLSKHITYITETQPIQLSLLYQCRSSTQVNPQIYLLFELGKQD